MTNATLLQTQVTPNNCKIQRGSGWSLWAPYPISGPRRWLSKCLCLMRIGHWPDHLPSSCSLGWWRPLFTTRREEFQSSAERSADECSAPPPHPGGVPSPSGEYPGGPLCRQRILDQKKISTMALNSTRPVRETSLTLYR
jgi:hypothetical protein